LGSATSNDSAGPPRRARPPLLRFTFEHKIIGVALIGTLGALTLSFLLFQWQDWAADEANLAADQMALARQISAAASRLDPVGIAQARAVFFADEHADGAIYLTSDGRRLQWARPGFDLATLRASREPSQSVKFDLHGVVIHVPQHANGRLIGELVLHAHNRELVAGARRNILAEIGLALLAMVASGLLARVLVRRALRPLRALGRAIDDVRRTEDFAHPTEILSDDEFGRLGEGFNALLAELETFSRKQRETLKSVTAGRDAAEEANLLKSQFLANMSHEIRTPLNGVLGMAQVVMMGDLPEVQRGRLKVIEDSASDLLSILNDILDVTKIEAGSLELEHVGFDLEAIAHRACDIFVASARAKGLTFSLVVTEGARGGWIGDPVRLRQVLANLISNAVKFTLHGGVEVLIDASPTGLSIAVSDTGIGIAQADLSRLFDRFTQVDASTTRRFGGAGLGLTICRDIVALMGGDIDVESVVGDGARFTVRLPMRRMDVAGAEPSADSDDDAPLADLSRLRVLAAEDNATNQLVLRTMLGSLGVEALIVENGRAAVEAWKAGDFDLVLMDIQMPVLDGAAATREIRALEASAGAARTRIVAVTANALTHQVAEYLAAGMDGHLAKPIVVPDLYAVLAEAFASSTAKETAQDKPANHKAA
jgi:signal transduction histidine kinase/CheY-like chemotaxis protein